MIKLIQKILQEYDENFNQVDLKLIQNKSGYNSIAISSDATLYRPKVENALFARVKTTGKNQYISFRNKYKNWFSLNNIPFYEVKSDSDFFRVTLEDFNFMLNFSEVNFAEIASRICLDAMNFTKFGCCDKFVKCSDLKKCIHSDLLYSTACLYRGNLENGKVFYGKNKNI